LNKKFKGLTNALCALGLICIQSEGKCGKLRPRNVKLFSILALIPPIHLVQMVYAVSSQNLKERGKPAAIFFCMVWIAASIASCLSTTLLIRFRKTFCTVWTELLMLCKTYSGKMEDSKYGLIKLKYLHEDFFNELGMNFEDNFTQNTKFRRNDIPKQ